MYFSGLFITLRKLHLSEALNWRRDTVALHQDVVLLPHPVVPHHRHVQYIARSFPAEDMITQIQKVTVSHSDKSVQAALIHR